MYKRITALILIVMLAVLSVTTAPAGAAESRAEQYLNTMSTEDKISMMIMPSFRYIRDASGNRSDVTEITQDIADSLAKHPYAGVILFSQNTPTNANTVKLIDQFQKANAVGSRPQLLITTDQEGGSVTRLGQGTMTPGNMALGAINDLDVTAEVAAVIGSELSAVGVNADFAPVVDVNSDPSNPVIGVRSFSDDAQVVASHGCAFVRALNDAGVISTLKHFPGHGDTDTDSHSGLPSIDKSYEELKANELIPFKACIDAGSQMIMTAHIVYPQIEKRTYTSKKTGEQIHIPATLSKTIITDILRGDMGFDGVVITDAMEMDAIAQHFEMLDAARLAIEAGVDILLAPVNMSYKESFAGMDLYISTLAQMADNGTIPMENVNAAVLRILKLKEKNGLFDPYDGSDIDARVQNAINTVGTKQRHDREWEITKQAITLVKNDYRTLPLTKENQKTVVLVPYDDETTPMEYAVTRLKKENKFPAEAEFVAFSYYKKTAAEVLPVIRGADNVVFMSEIYSASALRSDAAKMVDALADTVHAQGGRFILMSVNLPYDVARFTKADAIMIAYLPCTMPVDPGDKKTEIKQYGPNMPAALYMMFSEEDAPTAKLPINIPTMDETYYYTRTPLYEKGFGLTYTKPILGDVDADGKVTILDATAIQRRLAQMTNARFDDSAADADADGKLTILDATAIQRWIVKLPTNENIGKPIA